MNAWDGACEPLEGLAGTVAEALLPAAEDAAPFALHRAAAPGSPLIFASPHSGRLYPAEMMALSALDGEAIRRSEDAFVDALIAAGPAHGATTLSASYARAFVDVNREAYELDPAM